MFYHAFCTIWNDRPRFVPGIIAVACSGLLVAVQAGILIGIVSAASLPVDDSRADIWLAYPGTRTADVGVPVPRDWRAYLAMQPEITRTEELLIGYLPWKRGGNSVEMCSIIGSRLDDSALGAPAHLSPELRARLMERGTAVVDEADQRILGVERIGDSVELLGRRVKMVGFVSGVRNVLAAYVFCSLETARDVLRGAGLRDDQTSYVLASCRRPEDAPAVVARLNDSSRYSVFTAGEFSRRSRLQWLTRSNAGLAICYTTALGLIVGAIVTAQMLAAAVNAALREFAMLAAFGVPRRKASSLVVCQAIWIGAAGIALALPAALLIAHVLRASRTTVYLPAWLLAATAALTLITAIFSAWRAIHSLRFAEPAILLR